MCQTEPLDSKTRIYDQANSFNDKTDQNSKDRLNLNANQHLNDREYKATKSSLLSRDEEMKFCPSLNTEELRDALASSPDTNKIEPSI